MSEVATQAVDVVAREIGVSLGAARQSLEAYAEQPATPGALERCSELLHEVCGVLRVVEVYGAALLAEWPENAGGFANEPGCLAITLEVADGERIAIVEGGSDWLGRMPC